MLLAALGPPVSADEKEESLARVLFQEGRRLASGGRYGEACEKLEQSLKLEEGIGTRFNLADCWEHLGRMASAHELYSSVAEAARARGQMDREQAARERAQALIPRISHLVVEIDPAEKEARVLYDGKLVDTKRLRAPLAADPGQHVIEVSAEGRKPWTSTFTVPVSATITVIKVPALEKVAEAPAGDKPDSKRSKPERKRPLTLASTPESRPTRSSGRTASVLGFGLAGVGVAGLAVGTFFALSFKSKNDQARKICPTSVGCAEDEVSRHDGLVSDARTARTWAIVGYGVGAAAVAGSVIVFTAGTSRREITAPPRLVATPWLGEQGSWGARAQWRW